MPENQAAVPHILIAGGGYVGLYTGFGLRRLLRRDRVRVTLVDPLSYMTYQPFLPEAAAGSLEPRHVIVPLRQVLPNVHIMNGRVIRIDHARKVALVERKAGGVDEISYDHVVVALGSISRTLPIPGLAEEGIGFKWIEEAISMRNRVLDMFDLAESTDDPEVRRRACAAGRCATTSTSTSARSRALACTRESPRYTGSRCAPGPPGSCTAPITSAAFRRSIGRCASCWTGRWRSSSAAI